MNRRRYARNLGQGSWVAFQKHVREARMHGREFALHLDAFNDAISNDDFKTAARLMNEAAEHLAHAREFAAKAYDMAMERA